MMMFWICSGPAQSSPQPPKYPESVSSTIRPVSKHTHTHFFMSIFYLWSRLWLQKKLWEIYLSDFTWVSLSCKKKIRFGKEENQHLPSDHYFCSSVVVFKSQKLNSNRWALLKSEQNLMWLLVLLVQKVWICTDFFQRWRFPPHTFWFRDVCWIRADCFYVFLLLNSETETGHWYLFLLIESFIDWWMFPGPCCSSTPKAASSWAGEAEGGGGDHTGVNLSTNLWRKLKGNWTLWRRVEDGGAPSLCVFTLRVFVEDFLWTRWVRV